MILGMTHAELGLVVFVFGLVYIAAFVPKMGAFVGRKLAGGRASPPGDKPGG